MFDMKSAARRELSVEQKESLTKQNDIGSEQSETVQKSEAFEGETKREAVQEAAAPDISARDKNNVERYLKIESGCVFELA